MAKQRISGADAERMLLAQATVKAAGIRLRDATMRAAEIMPSAFEPRELAIDLDSVSIGQAALLSLLLERGVISAPDYMESLAIQMVQEAEQLERETANGRTELEEAMGNEPG